MAVLMMERIGHGDGHKIFMALAYRRKLTWGDPYPIAADQVVR